MSCTTFAIDLFVPKTEAPSWRGENSTKRPNTSQRVFIIYFSFAPKIFFSLALITWRTRTKVCECIPSSSGVLKNGHLTLLGIIFNRTQLVVNGEKKILVRYFFLFFNGPTDQRANGLCADNAILHWQKLPLSILKTSIHLVCAKNEQEAKHFMCGKKVSWASGMLCSSNFFQGWPTSGFLVFYWAHVKDSTLVQQKKIFHSCSRD